MEVGIKKYWLLPEGAILTEAAPVTIVDAEDRALGNPLPLY